MPTLQTNLPLHRLPRLPAIAQLDFHAPELLSDVLLPKDQLKKSVNVVKAVGKMQALTRSSKVHPAGGEAKAANKYAVAVTAE